METQGAIIPLDAGTSVRRRKVLSRALAFEIQTTICKNLSHKQGDNLPGGIRPPIRDSMRNIYHSAQACRYDRRRQPLRHRAPKREYNLNFPIARGKYNPRILYYIRKMLGVRSVNAHKTMGLYRIERCQQGKILPYLINTHQAPVSLSTQKEFVKPIRY